MTGEQYVDLVLAEHKNYSYTQSYGCLWNSEDLSELCNI